MLLASLRVFLSRLLDRVYRHRRDRRLDEEISEHLQELTDQLVAGGLSPAEGRRAAQRSFGGVDRMKSTHRHQRGLAFIDALLQDLKFAGRLLVKDRWFSAAAVAALALGVGVNTTVFTFISGMTWQDLPVDEPDEIVHLVTFDDRGRYDASFPDFLDWRQAATSFSGLAAYRSYTVNVGDGKHPAEQAAGVYLSDNAFSILRKQPILGRDFRPEDNRPGAPPVAMLGYDLWRARFGEDRTIVGQSIRLNGEHATVIGVMPPGFLFPVEATVWQPLAAISGLEAERRDARAIGVFGRLAEGASLDGARAEMAAISAAIASQHRDTNTGLRAGVIPFTERWVAPLSQSPQPLLMLWAAAFVQLIACANVGSLLLARATHRRREVALRMAMGASRLRVLSQLLVESFLLASIAGIFGLLFAVGGVRVLSAELVDLGLPYWIQFPFDRRVFVYLTAVCAGTALLFGLAPAWQLSNTRAHEALKEGGRGTTGGLRARRWNSLLLVGEVALTLVLLAGAGLLTRSARALHDSDMVVAPESVLTARLSLPAAKFTTDAQRLAFYQQLEERMGGLDLIASSLTSALPFRGGAGRRIALDQEMQQQNVAPVVGVSAISDGYFESLGLSLLRGRPFNQVDGTAGQSTAIVNERFATLFSPGRDLIGRQIQIADAKGEFSATQSMTIVGIAPTMRQSPMRDAAPAVYVPLRSQPPEIVAVIARARINGQRDMLAGLLAREVQAIDPDVALFRVMAFERVSESSRFNHRLMSALLTLFSVIATGLSALGLYAVTAYGVSQRTSEIGIRIALGARRGQVSWLFLKGTVLKLAAGVILGLVGAVAVGQIIRGLLIRTSPLDPLTFIGSIALLLAVAVLACLLPVRHASRIDPVIALKEL